MQRKSISVQQAQERLVAGAKILDVREYPEWVQSHIPGAELIPLSKLKSDPQLGAIADEVLLLCRTGRRAGEAARLLKDKTAVDPHVIEGGIVNWQREGYKTQKATSGPISMERQVRIGAGSLMLLGLLIPQLRLISWLVPCGLIFAGITDHCGMAKLLSKAPWNRPRSGTTPQKSSYSSASTCNGNRS